MFLSKVNQLLTIYDIFDPNSAKNLSGLIYFTYVYTN